MKYIMFAKKMSAGLTHYEPVIFPNNLVHVEVAKAMCAKKGSPLYGYLPRSAGEYTAGECVGNSETLKLKAHKDDSNIVMMCDYGGNWR